MVGPELRRRDLADLAEGTSTLPSGRMPVELFRHPSHADGWAANGPHGDETSWIR